ncbi:MAG TPA: efflux RND transporter periplasmic adaptor subunit [Ktedonobacteraceae bacterium]|nr:efflux RND transporter periplasmic adaptor subunit [Ktedonobacteraceae bacterium]
MSQKSPQSDEEVLPFPDFHEDIFADESPKPHPRRKLLILASILCVLLLLGIVLIVVAQHRPRVVYQAQSVTEGDLQLTVNADGQLRTTVYTANFVGSGKLAEVDVNVGQQVKKDQILAKLDATSLQNALNEAQSNVGAAQTALNTARANYDAITTADASNVTAAQNALNTADTFLILVRSKAQPDPLAVSSAQSRVDAAKLQLSRALGQQQTQDAAAQGAIDTAQATLNSAQAHLEAAQYNMNNVVLKAPHDGTISAINGTIGSTPGSAFIQLLDLRQMQVQVNVDASSIGSVAVDDAASFSLDVYRQQVFNGRVAAILPLGQPTSRATTYSVLITILANSMPNTAHLFPGMAAHATITTNDVPNALLVPNKAIDFARAAVNPRPETDSRSLISHAQATDALIKANTMLQYLQQDVPQEQAAYVLALDAHGKIVVRPVVIGLTNGSMYEVLDGLSTDDAVLVGARMESK